MNLLRRSLPLLPAGFVRPYHITRVCVASIQNKQTLDETFKILVDHHPEIGQVIHLVKSSMWFCKLRVLTLNPNEFEALVNSLPEIRRLVREAEKIGGRYVVQFLASNTYPCSL